MTKQPNAASAPAPHDIVEILDARINLQMSAVVVDIENGRYLLRFDGLASLPGDTTEDFMSMLGSVGKAVGPTLQRAAPGIIQGATTGATVGGPPTRWVPRFHEAATTAAAPLHIRVGRREHPVRPRASAQ